MPPFWLLSFGIGSIAQTIGNTYLRVAFQTAAHGLYNGISSELQGGKFIHGFAAGAFGSLGASLSKDILKVGTVGQIFAGGVSGSIGSAVIGGNFYRGFVQGIIVSAFNHTLHNAMGEEGSGDGGSTDGSNDPPSRLAQIAAELEAMKTRMANAFSDGVTYTSSSFDVGGLGVPVDYKSRLPMGNKGEGWTSLDKNMFRVKYFGMTLTGNTGYYTLKGLKIGGSIFTEVYFSEIVDN